MSNSKKIIISAFLALIVLIVFYIVMYNINNSQYIEISIFNKDKLKGEPIKQEDLTTIKVIKDNIGKFELEDTKIDFKPGQITRTNIIKGQLYTKEILADNQLENVDGYQCVAIPVTKSNYSVAYKVSKGDNITVYYTAKNKDISKAISGKEKLYSNESSDGMVTCRLFENIEVVSVSNSVGEEQVNTGITDIIVLLNYSDALLLANLKSQGIFDVVIN